MCLSCLVGSRGRMLFSHLINLILTGSLEFLFHLSHLIFCNWMIHQIQRRINAEAWKIIFLSHSCTVNPRQASYLAKNKWLNMCSENISDIYIGDPSLRCCTDLQFHFFHVLSLGWRSPGIKAFSLPGLLDNFWYRLELCSRLKNHAYCKNKLAKL